MGWILSQLLDCFAKEQYRALRLRALNVAGLLFSKVQGEKSKKKS